MFAEVVRAGSEIDNLGAIRNGRTAFVGHARWLDHLNVGFRITAMRSRFLVYDDDATLDATVDEMEILVSSFWHFRACVSVSKLLPSATLAKTVWGMIRLPRRRNWEPRMFSLRKYGLS